MSGANTVNWRVWTAFAIVVVLTAVSGTLGVLRGQGRIIEPTSENVTHIEVDLELPYQGTVSVTYPEASASDDLLVVVAALRDIHELLDQYFVPYEDPDDVRVRRRRGQVSTSFPIFAKERLDFIFPEVVLVGSWIPLWETLRVTVLLPRGYEVTETMHDGFEEDFEADERTGRWELTGLTRTGGRADFTIRYSRADGNGREEP